jgi:hypothetical protein
MENPMTDVSSHELGKVGRPLSPANRKARLRMEYINAAGAENLTPALSEAILAAVELQVLAAEVRRKVSKTGGTAEDLSALVRLENSAARAIARLNLSAHRGTLVQPDTIDTHAAV